MNNTGRKCYASIEAALAGAIEQMMAIETVGHAQSIEDGKIAEGYRIESALSADRKHRELIRRLGKQIKPKQLTPEEVSEIVYPKGSKHE